MQGAPPGEPGEDLVFEVDSEDEEGEAEVAGIGIGLEKDGIQEEASSPQLPRGGAALVGWESEGAAGFTDAVCSEPSGREVPGDGGSITELVGEGRSVSGFLAPRSKDILNAVQGRLELKWCAWPGEWDSFVKSVRSDGSKSEVAVLDQYPEEFKSRALEKAGRLSQWQENRLMSLLAKMEDLTIADKQDPKTGEVSADNPVRYQATKFLLERTLGKVPESGSPLTQTGQELQDVVERREELRRILTNRGDQIEETIRIERRPVGDEPVAGGES